ncbi:MAG: hypothetical protein FJ029_05390 [Actinobacteria bacterium]|nr:hypothetical protein [Actinomycetota bacterium]
MNSRQRLLIALTAVALALAVAAPVVVLGQRTPATVDVSESVVVSDALGALYKNPG